MNATTATKVTTAKHVPANITKDWKFEAAYDVRLRADARRIGRIVKRYAPSGSFFHAYRGPVIGSRYHVGTFDRRSDAVAAIEKAAR